MEVGNVCQLTDLAREAQMSLKRIVIAFGLAAMAFGIWTLAKAHSQVGTCPVARPTGFGRHLPRDALGLLGRELHLHALGDKSLALARERGQDRFVGRRERG